MNIFKKLFKKRNLPQADPQIMPVIDAANWGYEMSDEFNVDWERQIKRPIKYKMHIRKMKSQKQNRKHWRMKK